MRVNTDMTAHATRTRTREAAAGSALACFGVNGSATRLYCLTLGDPNSPGVVVEFAWQVQAMAESRRSMARNEPPAIG